MKNETQEIIEQIKDYCIHGKTMGSPIYKNEAFDNIYDLVELLDKME